jgi:hypothetical protein
LVLCCSFLKSNNSINKVFSMTCCTSCGAGEQEVTSGYVKRTWRELLATVAASAQGADAEAADAEAQALTDIDASVDYAEDLEDAGTLMQRAINDFRHAVHSVMSTARIGILPLHLTPCLTQPSQPAGGFEKRMWLACSARQIATLRETQRPSLHPSLREIAKPQPVLCAGTHAQVRCWQWCRRPCR